MEIGDIVKYKDSVLANPGKKLAQAIGSQLGTVTGGYTTDVGGGVMQEFVNVNFPDYGDAVSQPVADLENAI